MMKANNYYPKNKQRILREIMFAVLWIKEPL